MGTAGTAGTEVKGEANAYSSKDPCGLGRYSASFSSFVSTSPTSSSSITPLSSLACFSAAAFSLASVLFFEVLRTQVGSTMRCRPSPESKYPLSDGGTVEVVAEDLGYRKIGEER